MDFCDAQQDLWHLAALTAPTDTLGSNANCASSTIERGASVTSRRVTPPSGIERPVRQLTAALTLCGALILACAAPADAAVKGVSIAVADARAIEGGTGDRNSISFVVTLSRPATRPVSVSFLTSDATAVAETDYIGTSGLLTFAPSSVAQVVTVEVIGDESHESDETLVLQLSGAIGGSLAAAIAIGTIIDDDLPVGIDSPIVATALGTGETHGHPRATPFTTGIVSPSADALVVLQLATAGPSAELPAAISGAGLQFDELAELRPDPESPRTVGYYIAQSSATMPGQIRMTWTPFGPDQGALSYSLTQYQGVAVGSNGRTAIVQLQASTGHTNATTLEGQLNALDDPVRNAVVSFFVAGARGQDIIPEAEYTEVTGLISQASIFSLGVAFNGGGADLTPSASWQRKCSNLWLAIELAAAPEQTGAPRP
jgi:hypothetical protein